MSNILTNNYVYNGIPLTETRTYKLWESTGKILNEANLSNAQINRLFTNIEKAQTALGGNRTMIGKGKDAVSAVNRAWEDLKTRMQNSKPVTGFDQKVSDVLSKIGMGAKDPQFQGQVSGWVQKYRDFAKKHPVAQGAIYATLIALSGLTGAGIAGAASVGLLKMADKLIQGERFSSAAYSGVKTGLLAYAASQIADLLRTPPQPGQPVVLHTPPAAGGHDITVKAGDTLSQIAKDNHVSVDQLVQANKDILNPDVIKAGQSINVPDATYSPVYDKGVGTAADTFKGMQTGRFAPNAASYARAAKAGLSESQVSAIFADIEKQYELALLEGAGWDKFKSGIGKAMSGIATGARNIGHNITTKVTADKLMSAWKKAGSPTDSTQIFDVLIQYGIGRDVIEKTFKKMKIAAPSGGGMTVPPGINPVTGKPWATKAGALGAKRLPQGGGKVPGYLSQTPNAIRKRQARAAAKAKPAARPVARKAAPAARPAAVRPSVVRPMAKPMAKPAASGFNPFANVEE